MEIEFKEGSRSRRLLLIVGIVLAFATAVGVFAMTSGTGSAQADVPMTTVVIAAVDISPRTVLDAGMLTTRTLPDDPALLHAYTDTEALIGRATGTAIYAQQPITPNLMATAAVGSTFSVLTPGEVIGPETPDWRAVSVDVTDERAVGGMLVIGQRIDLVVSASFTIVQSQDNAVGPGVLELYGRVEVPAGEATPPGLTDCRLTPYGEALTTDETVTRYCAPSQYFESRMSTKLAFQDIEVIAREGTRYVLRVDAKTGEAISHLQADGNAFSLMLRGEGDGRVVDTSRYGSTTNGFLEDHGFEIPQSYPRPDDGALVNPPTEEPPEEPAEEPPPEP